MIILLYKPNYERVKMIEIILLQDSLKWIAVRYQELYDADLFDNVKDECSGYYKSVLLSLIKGCYVSKDE